jgi:hypothetical protein
MNAPELPRYPAQAGSDDETPDLGFAAGDAGGRELPLITA